MRSLLEPTSKVIGAGIENPEDLASLHQFLSSKVLLVLIYAGSILNSQRMDAKDIYARWWRS